MVDVAETEFTDTHCPSCGAGKADRGLTVLQIAIPAAFRTDFSNGRDAKEVDGEFLPVGMSSLANPSGANDKKSTVAKTIGSNFPLG